MSKTKDKTNSNFTINVPVFVSERFDTSGEMFDFNYQALIDGAITSLEKYNEKFHLKANYIFISKKNKFYQRQIGNIEYEKCSIGDVPALLLKVSAYTFNKKGEHIKEDEIVSIELSDRIGDDANHFLLLPQIVGDDSRFYNWIAFVYDDPSRDSEEIISILKSIMNDIIKRPIKNIKLPALINELKHASPKITLRLNSVINNENSINDKFQAYQIEGKSFIKQEFKYAGMPLEEIEELIKDKPSKDFTKKIIKFFIGQKEYKIQQEVDNFKTGINLLVEQHFNFALEIADANIDKIYTTEFILEVMSKALDKYLTNGEL